jgi:hypothetical protein
MSELGSAKREMNWRVGQELDSRDIFDPASLDAQPRAVDPVAMMRIDDALELGDGRVSIAGGSPAPWMPWEIIL